jgi:hydrogenase maturation protease
MGKSEKILVIGVGNADCGDDAVGSGLIDELDRSGIGTVEAVRSSGEPSQLIELFDGRPAVFLIDAVEVIKTPGRIHRFDVSDQELPAEFIQPYSTHGMGVHQAIGLARAINSLPPVSIVYAVEGVRFEPGATMTPEVRSNLPVLCARLEEDLRRHEVEGVHSTQKTGITHQTTPGDPIQNP